MKTIHDNIKDLEEVIDVAHAFGEATGFTLPWRKAQALLIDLSSLPDTVATHEIETLRMCLVAQVREKTRQLFLEAEGMMPEKECKRKAEIENIQCLLGYASVGAFDLLNDVENFAEADRRLMELSLKPESAGRHDLCNIDIKLTAYEGSK